VTTPNPKITERQVLEALWPWGEPGDYSPVTRLVDVTGQSEKAALRKIESLVDKGLADYGVSAVYAWRTPEGEARLAELRGKVGEP
jgi:hypothetical protein